MATKWALYLYIITVQYTIYIYSSVYNYNTFYSRIVFKFREKVKFLGVEDASRNKECKPSQHDDHIGNEEDGL